ncbi:hypothetical protein V8F06_000616 [Rhypophila decipiens]
MGISHRFLVVGSIWAVCLAPLLYPLGILPRQSIKLRHMPCCIQRHHGDISQQVVFSVMMLQVWRSTILLSAQSQIVLVDCPVWSRPNRKEPKIRARLFRRKSGTWKAAT